MKKKEMKLYAATLVECGRGLALADMMPEGKARDEAERIINLEIDSILTQLELLCEDVSFKKIEEVLNNAKES